MSADLLEQAESRFYDRNAFWTGTGFLLAAMGVAIALAVGGIGAFQWAPECQFHRVTGMYCLGCGGTRSLAALAHGKVGAALALNPLVLLFFVPAYLSWSLNLISYGKRGKWLFTWKPGKWQIVAIVLAALAFMILRNVPYYPFTILAPH